MTPCQLVDPEFPEANYRLVEMSLYVFDCGDHYDGSHGRKQRTSFIEDQKRFLASHHPWLESFVDPTDLGRTENTPCFGYLQLAPALR